MSENAYTCEPGRAVYRDGKPFAVIHRAMVWEPVSPVDVDDFARRAVACVNACAGLADPSVVPALFEALRGLTAIAAIYEAGYVLQGDEDEMTARITEARAALSAARGES